MPRVKLFVESTTCRSRAHCRTCRDLTGGRAWRESLRNAAWTLPDNDPDFACPHGAAWGESTAPPVERKPVEPVHPDQWPAWANAIAAMRAPNDTGVGSTVERELGRAGTVFKATLKALGVPCGCGRRKAEWDAKYPY